MSDEVEVIVGVPNKRVAELFCTGLEGGYSPWLQSFHAKSEVSGGEGIWYSRPEFWAGEFKVEARFDGKDDAEGSFATTRVLKPADLRRALELMANDYPSHFGDFMSENDDADTGDVFLQLLCLGEVVYG